MQDLGQVEIPEDKDERRSEDGDEPHGERESVLVDGGGSCWSDRRWERLIVPFYLSEEETTPDQHESPSTSS